MKQLDKSASLLGEAMHVIVHVCNPSDNNGIIKADLYCEFFMTEAFAGMDIAEYLKAAGMLLINQSHDLAAGLKANAAIESAKGK